MKELAPRCLLVNTCTSWCSFRIIRTRSISVGETSRSTSPVGSASLVSPHSTHQRTPTSSNAPNMASRIGCIIMMYSLDENRRHSHTCLVELHAISSALRLLTQIRHKCLQKL